ncbi:hypothetical protein V5O48_001907 [Marasmius crinis-equi]|uniref:protein-tyrosine-phosphatase n=1 Tax=Marasmius crinis-equi TaxID=585013 RepID=A0ABR3FXE6_9AGAR
MDFFATSHKANQGAEDVDNTEGFAKAIQQRFGPGSTSLLNNFDPRSLPTPKKKDESSLSLGRLPAAPGAGGSGSTSGAGSSREPTGAAAAAAAPPKQTHYPPEYFKSISPADLETVDAFIIDIRPHAAYASARIPTAISLSVPTTLLKRPLFSLDRLAAMLPSPNARERFGKWREAKKVVVYDADTSGGGPSGTLAENSNILGLLRKFANDQAQGKFEGELFWLKGGFQRVWRERRHLVDTGPPPDDDDEENSSVAMAMKEVGKDNGGSRHGASNAGFGGRLGGTLAGALRPNTLPPSAFSTTSTTRRPLPTPSLRGIEHGRSAMALRYNPPQVAANPFFDAIRQNTELSQGITERIPLRLPRHVRRRLDDLPFEWLKDIGRRAAPTLETSSTSTDSDYESESSSESSGDPAAGRRKSPAARSQDLPPSTVTDSSAVIEDEDLDPEKDEKELFLSSAASAAAIIPSTNQAKISSQSSNFTNNGSNDSANSAGSLSPQAGSAKAGSSPNSQESLSPNNRSSDTSPGSSQTSLTDPDPTLVDEGMENLAMQFYRIELAEQRRLMGIMQHHSKESEMENKRNMEDGNKQHGNDAQTPSANMQVDQDGRDKEKERVHAHDFATGSGDVQMQVDDESNPAKGHTQGVSVGSPSTPFPYSITAGVEKGAKNRYRHIWPFEHARVKLHQRRPDEPGQDQDSAEAQPCYATPSADSMAVSPFKQPSSVFQPPSSASSSGLSNATSNSSPFVSASLAQSAPRFPGINVNSMPTPSGALTGPLFGPGQSRSPSPPKPASAGPSSNGGPGGFTLTLPMKRNRTSSGGAMPPPPPPNPRPSMSLAFPPTRNSSSLPPSFTQYRSHAGSGSGNDESTATESEWESGTDKAYSDVPGLPRKKESSAERKKREEAAKKQSYDDYVNASYVQPLCTTRRYIATQGPLEATFNDFWTLVYQQNVHVIVMLTREVEGSMIKCGAYWKDEWYGPLQLKQLSIEGRLDEEQERQVGESGVDKSSGGFYFPVMPDPEEEKSKKSKKRVKIKEQKKKSKGVDKENEKQSIKNRPPSSSGLPTSRGSPSSHTKLQSSFGDLPIIKRTFELRHTGYPHVPPRKVVHLQFLDWPDMNVPEDPKGLLGLIQEVDTAVAEADVLEPGPDSVESETDEASATDPALTTKATGVRFFEGDRPRKHSRKRSNEEIDKKTGVAKHALGRANAPVLLHCSAGVGRTGGYIAIDAVLDGIRREIRKGREAERRAEEKLERARRQLEARLAGEDVVMNEASPSGTGSGGGSGSGDIDMADATMMETVPIEGHDRNVFHVAVHREMVHDEGPNPHEEQRRKTRSRSRDSSRTHGTDDTHAKEVQTPMPMQVDPMSALSPADLKKKAKQDADTTTRMWSQNVSDQTGNYGNASRVTQDTASRALRAPTVSGPSSTVASSSLPGAVPLSEVSSQSASDDSYGFPSSFDKRFSGKTPIAPKALKAPKAKAPKGRIPYLMDKGEDGSNTSLSAGSGGQAKSHRRASSSNPPKPPTPPSRGRAGSVPSGRPAEVSAAVGEGANKEPFLIPPCSDAGRRSAPRAERGSASRSTRSSTPWLPAEGGGRGALTVSPSPFASSDPPPPSRSLSPSQLSATAETSSYRGGSNELSGGSGELSGGSSGDLAGGSSGPKLRLPNGEIGSDSPPAIEGSGAGSGGSGPASLPATTSGSGTGSGGGSGSGSGAGSGNGSGPGSVSGSQLGSRSRSASIVNSSPMDAGVLPAAGADSRGSVSLKGFDKKLDKVALAAAEAASSKLKSTEAQRASFDYTEPRPLHQHDSPNVLSIYKVPLWEVIQDMREQRMSLCQSLRQYVFVHAVVVEGALMVLDEENKKDGIHVPRRKIRKSKGKGKGRGKGLGKHLIADELMSDGATASKSDVSFPSTLMSKASGTSSNKRQASPTELPQEDKKGGQLLHKKPSLKRKPGTSSDESLPTMESSSPM